jgi:hypothetical protein
MPHAQLSRGLVLLVATTGCPLPPPAPSTASSSSGDGQSTGSNLDLPTSCRDVAQDTGSGVYRIDPDGVAGADPFEVYCELEVAGGGWILVGRIGDRAEIDRDAFDWNLDVAGLRSDGEPDPGQYSHFDLSRFDAYGSEWTVMVQVDVRRGVAPLTAIERFTFFRARAGEVVLPGTVGRDWQPLGLERSLEHLAASKVDGRWAGGRNNSTWLPSDGAHPEWPYTAFHLMGHVDRSFPEFGDGETLTPDCIDEAGQTRPCFQTAGMLDDDPHGTRVGVMSGSPYRDGGPPAQDECWAHYWLRDDRVDQPQAE